MARIRSILPGAPLDEDVAMMSLAARYVWAYLPCHTDREGRLKDSAFTLKAAILPGDTIDMEAVLAELASKGLIVRYEIGGRRYIQVRNFLRYQNPHKKEPASVIPPQLSVITTTQESPDQTGSSPGATGTGPAVRSDPIQSGEGQTPPWPGPSGDPDPLTHGGLVAYIRTAVEKAQPRLGVYNPGQWAGRSVAAFLDAIPVEKRTAALRREVKARVVAFAASSDPRITKGSWSVEAFCEAYNRLGQTAAGSGSAEAASRRMAAKVLERGR